MRCSMLIKNDRGMSLVQIMIALAAVGGLSIVAMNMNKMSTHTVGQMKLSSDITLVMNELTALLADPEKCKLTFTTATETYSDQVTNFTANSDSIVYN